MYINLPFFKLLQYFPSISYKMISSDEHTASTRFIVYFTRQLSKSIGTFDPESSTLQFFIPVIDEDSEKLHKKLWKLVFEKYCTIEDNEDGLLLHFDSEYKLRYVVTWMENLRDKLSGTTGTTRCSIEYLNDWYMERVVFESYGIYTKECSSMNGCILKWIV